MYTHITPTSTPNSRLYSRTYLVFVLAKCHRCAMPLWFHWVFESQRRQHAHLVSICAGRRRDSPVPAPAPGLDHDYGQITARSQPLCCHALEVGVSEVRGQLVSGGQTMGQIMWTRESLGVKSWSKHVDTGVAGGQRGSNHVDTGGAGGQQGSNHVDTGVAGVKACGG